MWVPFLFAPESALGDQRALHRSTSARCTLVVDDDAGLPNGETIPQIHLGLYQMSPSTTHRAVTSALTTGYRAFDSAQWYHNESATGTAITSFLSSHSHPAVVSRPTIFYTSKLRSNSTSYPSVRESITRSVDACGLGYIDLFLLHSPYGGKEARLTSWRAVEDAILAGEVKSGGVSNYGVKHIEELMSWEELRVKPVVNQIEVHPFNTQEEIRGVCAKYGIVVQAYAPLAAGMRFGDATVVGMSGKYGCTPAQLLVRWSIQHGFVTLPKSSRPDRIAANADVGGFEISEEDMEILDGLDEKLVTDWDPTDAP
ncbi:NADP-dependent oxidoreductase domain-containing protein [Cercophora newfieldiana]|uniref:NADP-dependent oxidoreductase domain-containing protein n=1 Tax=Cercophora newfieldiana TaxID=92897 RepID=A0AA39YHU8_9PEZI|nr:NADP-dependent oxidoreductase domain-containing protein [Cercophora newfieldiana]